MSWIIRLRNMFMKGKDKVAFERTCCCCCCWWWWWSSLRWRRKGIYKVVQIWPGLVRLVYTQISPGHIWTTLYNAQTWLGSRWMFKVNIVLMVFRTENEEQQNVHVLKSVKDHSI
jgi:hypothetical protein